MPHYDRRKTIYHEDHVFAPLREINVWRLAGGLILLASATTVIAFLTIITCALGG